MKSKVRLLSMVALVLVFIVSIAVLLGYYAAAALISAVVMAWVVFILAVIHEQLVKRSAKLSQSTKSETREVRRLVRDSRNAQKLHAGRVDKNHLMLSEALRENKSELASINLILASINREFEEIRKLSPLLQAGIPLEKEDPERRKEDRTNSAPPQHLLRKLLGLVLRAVEKGKKVTSGQLTEEARNSTDLLLKKSGGEPNTPVVVPEDPGSYEGVAPPVIAKAEPQKSARSSPSPSPKPVKADLSSSVSKGIKSGTASLLTRMQGIDGSFETLTNRVRDAHPSTTSSAGMEERKPRVLLVSSNGAGLGHLTRLSAVERWMNADTLIYTMSSAYHRLGKSTKDVIYFPSHGDLGMAGKVWNVLMEEHFSGVIEGFEPDAIVFDGTYVYRGVINASKRYAIKLLWMQRGCWRAEVDARSKQRHDAHKFADGVLVPGDYGCEEVVDVGEGMSPTYLPPVTLTRHEDLLTRKEARNALGLPLDKKLFLVQLGAGVINDISDLRTEVVREVQALGDEWAPVLVRNPLSSHEELPEVHSIQAYPLGLYYNAFDAGAFAAGYNTVQESIELGLPSIFVPNLATKTDDQQRRASNLVSRNLALVGETSETLKTGIRELADDNVREFLGESMRAARLPGGAKAGAEEIERALAALSFS